MSMQLNVTVNPIFNSAQFASAGASAGSHFAAGLNSAVSRAQPLGRITGDVSQFEKSMEAANARVLAFGASAGAIFIIKSAFDKLISSTIQVEKSLADINTVLGLGVSSMKNFSNEMFKAAAVTGQTFETASKVALEFSRQGASAAETIKRMTAAMQLMRISGLSAEESVNSITSSLNAFSREMLTAEDVVNRLTAVDTRFAVSSRDLANAIQRVGSVADDAGVKFNELLGLVTAAQTITARGGAVIGNAFKSIFTRLARPQVLEDLESVGITTRNASGQILPMITVLKNLANQFNTLGASQRSFVSESVGGVYQINILKAALSDLGNGISIFDRAALAATQSTGLIEKRMAELNETISSKLNVSALEMTRLFSNIGQKAFGSSAKGAIDLFNKNLRTISAGFEDFAPDDSVGLRIGKVFAQGITKGIGNILSGPGIQVATTLLLKMLQNLGSFAIKSGKEFLGTNEALDKQKDIVQSINQFLGQNPQILAAIQAGQLNINQAHLVYLQQLQQENQLKQQSASIAATMATRAAPYITASKPPTPATGFIPNLALSESDMEKRMAISHGYTPGPTYKALIHDGKGRSSLTTVNAAETVKTITNSDGHKATFVVPPNGFGKDTLIAAGGFIPNFKTIDRDKIPVGEIIKKYKRLNLSETVQEKDTIELAPIKIEEIPIDKDIGIAKAYKKIKSNYSEINKASQEIEVLTQKFTGGMLTSAKDSGVKYGSSSALDIVGNDFAAEVKSGFYDMEKVKEKFLRFPIENAKQKRGISPYTGNFSPKEGDEIKSPENLILFKKPSEDKIREEIEKLEKNERKNKASGFIPNFASKIGVITGDALRGNQYKKALEYLANTNKLVTSIVGPAGSGKTSRAVNEYGGEIIKSTDFDNYESFIFDRAGFDLPEKDKVSAENIQKILKKSKSIDVLISSRDTLKKAREKRAGEGDKNIPERTYFKTGSGGAGTFVKGVRQFLSENENARVFKLKQGEKGFYHSQLNLASGFVPNFAEQIGPPNPQGKISDAAIIAGSFQQVWDKRISDALVKEAERKIKAGIKKGTPTTEEANLRTRYEEIAGTALTNYLESSPELTYTKILQRFHTNTLPGGGSFAGFDYVLDAFTNNNFLKNKLNWKDNYSMEVGGKQMTGAKGKMLLSMKTSDANEKAAEIRRKMELGKERLRTAGALGAEEQTSEILVGLYGSTLSNQTQAFKKSKKQLGKEDYNIIGPRTSYGSRGRIEVAAASGFVPNFVSENAINALREIASGKRGGTPAEIENAREKLNKILGSSGKSTGTIGLETLISRLKEAGVHPDTLSAIQYRFKTDGMSKWPEFIKNLKEAPGYWAGYTELPNSLRDKILSNNASGFVPNFFNHLNEARNILKENGLNLDDINNQNFSQFKEVIKSKVGGTNIGEYEKALQNYLYGGSSGWSLKKPSSRGYSGYREFGSGFVPNLALAPGGRFAHRGQLKGVYGEEGRQYSVTGFVNKMDPTRFTINWLEGVGKGAAFEKFIPQFKEDLKNIGVSNIDYTAEDSDGRQKVRNKLFQRLIKKYSGLGFVPNFNSKGLSEAIHREMAAGYSRSEVKVGHDPRLKESGGVGVYNKDEGTLADAINIHLASGKSLSKIQKQGAASGFVPNFADGDTFKTSLLLGVADYLSKNSQKFGKFLDKFTFGLDVGAKKMSEMYVKFDALKQNLSKFQQIRAAGGTLTKTEQVEEKAYLDELKKISADFKKMTGRDISTVSIQEKARVTLASRQNQEEAEARKQKISERALKFSAGAGMVGGFASTIAESFGQKDLAKGIDSITEGVSQAGQALNALPNQLGAAIAVGLFAKKLSEGLINMRSGVEAANRAYEQHKTVVERTSSALTSLQDGYQVLGNLVQSGNASISELNAANKKIAQSMTQLAAVSPEYARKMQAARTPEARAQVQAEITEEQGLKTRELGFAAQYKELQKKNMGMFGLVNYAGGEKYGQFTATSEAEVPIMEQMKSEAATLIQEQVLSAMEKGSPEEREKAAGIRKRFAGGIGTEEDAAEIQKRASSTSAYKMLGDQGSKSAVEQKMASILKELTIPKEKREAYKAALDQIQNAQIKEANIRKRYNQEIQNLLSRGTALAQFNNQRFTQSLGQKGRAIETKYGIEEQNFRLQSLVTSDADMARMRGESKQKQIQEQASLDVEKIKSSAGGSQLNKLGEVIAETTKERMDALKVGPGEALPGVDPRTLGLKTFFAKRQEEFSGEGAAKLFELSKKAPSEFAKGFLGTQEEAVKSGISKEDYESLLQKVTTKAAGGEFTKESGDTLFEIKDVLEKSNEDAKKSAAETQAAIKEANFKELANALGGLSLLAKGGERQMRRRIRRAEYLSERGRTAQARGRGASELLSLIPESQRDINNPYVSRLYGQVQSGMLAANANVLRGSKLGGSGVMGNLNEMAFAQTFGNLKASGMGSDFYKQAGLQVPEANIEPLNQSISQAAQDIQNFGAMLRNLGSDADNLKRALEAASQERQVAVQGAEAIATEGASSTAAAPSPPSTGLGFKQQLGEYGMPLAMGALTLGGSALATVLTRGRYKAQSKQLSEIIGLLGGGKAEGHMPDFSSIYKEKIQASTFGAGNVGVVPGMGTINGKSFLANNAETQIPNFMGSGETAVIPKYGGGERKALSMMLNGKSGPVLNAASGSIPDLTRHFTNSRASASVLKDNFAKGNIPDLNEFFEKVGKSRQSPKEYLRSFLRNKDISSLDISIDELKKLKDIGIDINNIKGKKDFSAVAKIKSIDELQEFINLSGKGTKDLTKFLEGRDFSMEEYKKLIGMGFEKEISGASLKIKSLDELKELRQIGSNLTNKELAEHFVKQSKNLSETQSKYLVKIISKQLEKGMPSQAVELGKSGGLLANAKDMIGGGKGLLQAGANWKKALKTSMGIGSKAGLFGMALQAGLLVNDLFESQDLREKGESGEANKLIGGGVGGLAGGVIGGALGSFFGPLGTMAGAYLGSMAGRWVGEGIGSLFPDSEKDVEKKLMNMRNAKKQRVENEKALAELKDRMKQRKLKQYEEGMTSSLGYMKEKGAFKDGRYDYKAISENIIKNKNFENAEHLQILRKRMAEERGVGAINYQQSSAMDTGLVGGLILSDKKSFEAGIQSFAKTTGKAEGPGRYGDLTDFISGSGKAIASGTAVTGAHLMEIGKRTSAEDQYKLLTNQYADKALEKLLSSGQNLDSIRKQYPDLDLTAANDIDQLADVMMGKPLAPKINPQTTKFLREKLRAEGMNGELFKIMQNTYFEAEQKPTYINQVTKPKDILNNEPSTQIAAAGNMPEVSNIQAAQNQKTLGLNSIASQKGSNQIDLSVELIKKLENIASASLNTAQNSAAGNQLLAKILNARQSDLGKPVTVLG